MIHENDGINDKIRLARLLSESFNLIRDRSVYYCTDYAIAIQFICYPEFQQHGSIVVQSAQVRRPSLSLSVSLHPTKNFCLIANTTFLKKIKRTVVPKTPREQHTRKLQRVRHRLGEFEGIDGTATENISLFDIHAEIGFEGNLPRLVEATNNISPSGEKFAVRDFALVQILSRSIPCH